MKEHESQSSQYYPPNRLYCRFFYYTTLFLLKRVYDRVYLTELPETDKSRSVICLLNHPGWIDGLIPLMLSERYFSQIGLALMEDLQIKEHPFFRKIGAQPISRTNPRSAIKTITLLSEQLKQEPSVLFIYPQGKIYPNRPVFFSFERGYEVFTKKDPSLQMMMVTSYTHNMWTAKPTLLLDVDQDIDPTTTIKVMEQRMTANYEKLEVAAMNQHKGLIPIT